MMESVIKRTRQKFDDLRMSRISEKSLDQSIVLNRQTNIAEKKKNAQTS